MKVPEKGDHLHSRAAGVQDNGVAVFNQGGGIPSDGLLQNLVAVLADRQRAFLGGHIKQHGASVDAAQKTELFHGLQLPADGGFAVIQLCL